MARGRPKAALVLSEDERAQLASFTRSRSLASALSNRAKIIVASADGETNSAIASRLQINPGTVRKWVSVQSDHLDRPHTGPLACSCAPT